VGVEEKKVKSSYIHYKQIEDKRFVDERRRRLLFSFKLFDFSAFLWLSIRGEKGAEEGE
jgi:hypothetical protein